MDAPPSRAHPRAAPGLRLPVVGFAVLAALVHSPPLSGQQLAPRLEDGEQPAVGVVWFEAAPVFQNWHREFGPAGAEIPLAADLDGPLLEQVYPGPAAVLSGLNQDADALGFSPVSVDESTVGQLQMRELDVAARAVAFTAQVGILDRLSLDVMAPVVRTEVEPFFSFDPTGATLAGAAGAVTDPGAFFGTIQDARNQLQQRVDSGQLSAREEQQARELLEESGAFASALQRRVEENALIPLAGSRAGNQLAAFYSQLQTGFRDFGLALPSFTLPAEGVPGFLDAFFLGTLAAERLGARQRGWLAGETELGIRFGLLQGFDPDREGLQLRTTVGIRARLPFRDPNTTAFVVPSDLVSVPLGDGQRDLEVALYQDLRWDDRLVINASARYGVQAADRLLLRVRSPERPLSLPAQLRQVERDLGDYLRVRFAPRYGVNRHLSVGVEYGLWHKRPDTYGVADSPDDLPALERETKQTRHRLGFGAFYRPSAPEDEEEETAEEDGRPGGGGPEERVSPEMGFVWQTALSGSGGETPVAGLVAFHVRIPARIF